MLRKLVTEPDVYDCACLLVIDGTQGKIKESDVIPDDRGPQDESASLVASEADVSEGQEDQDQEQDQDGDAIENLTVAPVYLLHDQVPNDLSAGSFFDKLVRSAVARTPVAMYPIVRDRLPD
jgi:hypothetical protein